MKKEKIKFARSRNGGQALLMAIIMFLFLSTGFVVAISNLILKQTNFTRDFLVSRKSYFLSEAGIEDAIYRIKNNKQISASEVLALDDGSAVITTQDTLGSKTINAVSDFGNLVRKVGVVLKTGSGVSFSYGMQSGEGGIYLGENTTINGSVYSSGDIIGHEHALVTGSVISANSSALTAVELNDQPLVPLNSITFADASSRQDFAQSFKVSAPGPLTKISLYIKKVGSPGSLNVRIVEDDGGNPSENTIVSATLTNTLVTTSYAWVDVSFSTTVALTSGVSYWLILDGDNSSTKYYIIAANNTYTNGLAKLGQYRDSWYGTSPSGLSGYFKIYEGGLTGSIENLSVGSAGAGDAQASSVTGSTVAGIIYCQTGSGNNKSCDTSKAEPGPIDFPVSEGNIAQWKADALAGGIITGDYTISSSQSIGPKKIEGNLTVNNNVTVTLDGTLWVSGNINMNNGSKIKLSSAYGAGSGVVVADGYIDVSNGSTFSGSGQTGSNLMILTTSDCPQSAYCDSRYAIDVSNNVGAVLLNAQRGTINMHNNVGVKEATAYKIYFDNNSVVNYEQGLANANFVSGPTGGWEIKQWKETE